MDLTTLRPDLPLVLTDWFHDTGYTTFHIASAEDASVGWCGRTGLPYVYYSTLLSPEDDMLCISCVDSVRHAVDELFSGEDI
jgi:hypothetical protein